MKIIDISHTLCKSLEGFPSEAKTDFCSICQIDDDAKIKGLDASPIHVILIDGELI